MLNIISIAKRTIAVALTVVMLNAPASAVFADEAPVCTPPEQTQAGVRWPTGSDSGTFTYQCEGAYAGQWTNAYYVYDPATNSRTALYSPDYSYDCDAGQWYKTQWDYSPAAGAYQLNTVQTTAPSGMSTGCPVAPVVDPAKTVDTDGDGVYDSPSTPETLAAAKANGGSAVNLDGTINTDLTNNTTANMVNGILSFANSGDALVAGNTTGGSATSGNARAISNIINMLQSSSNFLGGPDIITFTADINGDVNGDLLLDPAKLGAVQPAGVSANLDNNLTINNSLDAAIDNNIYLGANSGDATVARNTTAGNATSGTADAVANIVNILNSAVTAGRSFMGVININGNLNGDILLPPNFVDTLLASNVPHYTVNTANINSDLTLNNTNNSSINNHVNASADSGDATVANNTSAGNAATGLANTNLTIFNLTGNNVVASNDLLVFVNVLGTWYGLIMNAPAGTTAASLGGGVNSNTTVNDTTTLNNTAKQSINNNINVHANTGDATVASNTSAGNATSGDATASVNLLNMINNSISLNGWFGLLFINVYGTWNGSFGVNTAAGNPVQGPNNGAAGGGSGPMFQFVSVTPGGSNAGSTYSYGSGDTSGSSSDGVVLAASAVKNAAATLSDDGSPAQKAVNNMILPGVGVGVAFLILLASERKRFVRRH
jgi:hypothetical protein